MAFSRTCPTAPRPARFDAAFREAQWMLETYDNLEIRSALKEAGANNGIAYGGEMGEFVAYAEKRMGLA